jgi:hypothetical protein
LESRWLPPHMTHMYPPPHTCPWPFLNLGVEMIVPALPDLLRRPAMYHMYATLEEDTCVIWHMLRRPVLVCNLSYVCDVGGGYMCHMTHASPSCANIKGIICMYILYICRWEKERERETWWQRRERGPPSSCRHAPSPA